MLSMASGELSMASDELSADEIQRIKQCAVCLETKPQRFCFCDTEDHALCADCVESLRLRSGEQSRILICPFDRKEMFVSVYQGRWKVYEKHAALVKGEQAECQFCALVLPLEGKKEHESGCPEQTEDCLLCFSLQGIRKSDMEAHFRDSQLVHLERAKAKIQKVMKDKDEAYVKKVKATLQAVRASFSDLTAEDLPKQAQDKKEENERIMDDFAKAQLEQQCQQKGELFALKDESESDKGMQLRNGKQKGKPKSRINFTKEDIIVNRVAELHGQKTDTNIDYVNFLEKTEFKGAKEERFLASMQLDGEAFEAMQTALVGVEKCLQEVLAIGSQEGFLGDLESFGDSLLSVLKKVWNGVVAEGKCTGVDARSYFRQHYLQAVVAEFSQRCNSYPYIWSYLCAPTANRAGVLKHIVCRIFEETKAPAFVQSASYRALQVAVQETDDWCTVRLQWLRGQIVILMKRFETALMFFMEYLRAASPEYVLSMGQCGQIRNVVKRLLKFGTDGRLADMCRPSYQDLLSRFSYICGLTDDAFVSPDFYLQQRFDAMLRGKFEAKKRGLSGIQRLTGVEMACKKAMVRKDLAEEFNEEVSGLMAMSLDSDPVEVTRSPVVVAAVRAVGEVVREAFDEVFDEAFQEASAAAFEEAYAGAFEEAFAEAFEGAAAEAVNEED